MSKRSGSESRQRTRQIGVRLTPSEYDSVARAANHAGISVASLLRRESVGQSATDERVAAMLYEMNGRQWYGRSLGGWDDPDSRIGRNEFERDRWHKQAAALAPTEDETVAQNLACNVEKRMGIYPNLPHTDCPSCLRSVAMLHPDLCWDCTPWPDDRADA